MERRRLFFIVFLTLSFILLALISQEISALAEEEVVIVPECPLTIRDCNAECRPSSVFYDDAAKCLYNCNTEAYKTASIESHMACLEKSLSKELYGKVIEWYNYYGQPCASSWKRYISSWEDYATCIGRCTHGERCEGYCSWQEQSGYASIQYCLQDSMKQAEEQIQSQLKMPVVTPEPKPQAPSKIPVEQLKAARDSLDNAIKAMEETYVPYKFLFADAEDRYTEILNADPNNFWANWDMAELYKLQRDYWRFFYYFDKAINSGSIDAETRVKLRQQAKRNICYDNTECMARMDWVERRSVPSKIIDTLQIEAAKWEGGQIYNVYVPADEADKQTWFTKLYAVFFPDSHDIVNEIVGIPAQK